MTARSRRAALVLAAVALCLLLSACTAGANPAEGTGADPVGFWWGLWHGLISPVTFVVSLFNDDVGIYEVRNNGGWYNAGFMLGVMLVFSSGGHSGSRASRRGRGT